MVALYKDEATKNWLVEAPTMVVAQSDSGLLLQAVSMEELLEYKVTG